MKYLFCAHRDWAIRLHEKLSKKYKNLELLTDPRKLTLKNLKKMNPKMIFFPDWSWIIPKSIVKNYQCVCIHESDLPKFRGGSPIQNQIIRGIKQTKSTAFLMDTGIDTGDILLKKSLSLEGSINEIFQQMIDNDFELIDKIIKGKYTIKKQKGHTTIFKRRKPKQSELKDLENSKLYLYNFIRMLGDPYPNAFIKIGKKKLIFKSAKFDGKNISFNGVIE